MRSPDLKFPPLTVSFVLPAGMGHTGVRTLCAISDSTKCPDPSVSLLPSIYIIAPLSTPCFTSVVLLRPMPLSTMPEAVMRSGSLMVKLPSPKTTAPLCPLASGFSEATWSMACWISWAQSPACQLTATVAFTLGMASSDA